MAKSAAVGPSLEMYLWPLDRQRLEVETPSVVEKAVEPSDEMVCVEPSAEMAYVEPSAEMACVVPSAEMGCGLLEEMV